MKLCSIFRRWRPWHAFNDSDIILTSRLLISVSASFPNAYSLQGSSAGGGSGYSSAAGSQMEGEDAVCFVLYILLLCYMTAVGRGFKSRPPRC